MSITKVAAWRPAVLTRTEGRGWAGGQERHRNEQKGQG